MTVSDNDARIDVPAVASSAAPPVTEPTITEDLLLLLFQPDSGTIAGENTLFYALAGAVVADLAVGGQVRAEPGALGGTRLVAIPGDPPDDVLLRPGYDYIAQKPRGAQAVLAAIGPDRRPRVLDRLIDRGEIRRASRKVLGLFETSTLTLGGTGRRASLLADVRATLVDGADPTTRTAALAALLSGSGTLTWFDPDIPWSTPVITRAKALEQGDWGADATARAVARTMTAMLAGNAAIAVSIADRR